MLRETLEQQVEQLLAGLSDQLLAPFEELLVERIMVCCLQVQYADSTAAQNMKDVNLKVLEFYLLRSEADAASVVHVAIVERQICRSQRSLATPPSTHFNSNRIDALRWKLPINWMLF
jgi:hypothetical protein